MYKDLFILLFDLIVSPDKAWNKLSGEQDKNNAGFYRNYLYPVLGIIAICSFIGILIVFKKFDVQLALKTVIKDVLTYFAAFFSASWLLSKVLSNYFTFPSGINTSERFVAYSSAPIYITAVFQALFPSLFFIQILNLYSFYVIWKGASIYLHIEERDLTRFTIFAGAIVLFLPPIIGRIIQFLMPGL